MGKNEVVARNGTESLQLIKSPECRKRTLRTGDAPENRHGVGGFDYEDGRPYNQKDSLEHDLTH